MFSRRFFLAASVIGIFACAAQSRSGGTRQVVITENEVGFAMALEEYTRHDPLFGCATGTYLSHTPIGEPLKAGTHTVGENQPVHTASCGPMDFRDTEYLRTFYYDIDGESNLKRRAGNWLSVKIEVAGKANASCEDVDLLRNAVDDANYRRYQWPALEKLTKDIAKHLEKTTFVECREKNLRADDDACIKTAQKVASEMAAGAPDLLPDTFKININDKPWGELKDLSTSIIITKK